LGGREHDVVALVRRSVQIESGATQVTIPDDNFASLAAGVPDLGRCDVVIHLAGRVHVMRDKSAKPMVAYRASNVEGALNAAAAARRTCARRLVFVSSIKALGEVEPGRPWLESDTPAPVDPYGISKFEAECALLDYGRANGIEIVIVRPPLVYGPGVRANFLRLMKAVQHGVPLPLGAVDARRSMVYVANLADAIQALTVRPEPVNGVFHVSDGNDLTVAEMVQTMAQALGRPARLVRIPTAWLRHAGKVTGRTAQIDRLISPLRLDCSRLRDELGWTPPWFVSQGLAATVRACQSA
jgi:UDP-glucose 4-epimerase